MKKFHSLVWKEVAHKYVSLLLLFLFVSALTSSASSNLMDAQEIPSIGIIDMSKFQQEVERLRSILEQGYLQKDSRTTAVRGAHLLDSRLNFSIVVYEQEAKDMQSRGFNVVRSWYYGSLLDDYLTLMSEYSIKVIIIVPYPPLDIPYIPWRTDPFDYFTAADWQNALSPLLSQFGADSRIYAWDMWNEPFIKPEHYQDFKDVANFVKSQSTIPVTVGLDAFEQIAPLQEALDIISYHVYQFGEWATFDNPAKTPWQILDEKLINLKQYGKPILIEELGFPTYYRYPSNIGNTPYKIPTIVETTPETEQLQFDYLANMLHVIKEHNILGYIIWQWVDDPVGGVGGFGLKRRYPELTPKPALDLFP